MGWFKKVGNAITGTAKKIAGPTISNIVTNENVSKVFPVYGALTTGGRQALVNTYGGYFANQLNAQTGTELGSAALGIASDYVNDPVKAPKEDGGGGGGGGGYFAQPEASGDGSGTPGWLWPVAGVVGLVVVVIIFLRNR